MQVSTYGCKYPYVDATICSLHSVRPQPQRTNGKRHVARMYDPKRLVAQGYDTIADRYTVWAQQVRAEERARYTHLLYDTLPAHATLLELGCGAGLPTTRTLAQHFRV